MQFSWLRMLISKHISPRASAKKPHRRSRLTLEHLEGRLTPAVHEWTGLGTDNLWSSAANWTNGSPGTDASGDIDLVFHTNLTNAAQLVTQNDIAGLVLDSITFDANAGTGAAGGTSNSGYTINGNTITIDTSAAGQDPFGIDITTGVADATNGITETFNVGITLATADATFRVQDTLARLRLTGNVNLGTRTLTLDAVGATSNPGSQISGNISNGNLIKASNGVLQLSGTNSYANTTVNGGTLFVDSSTGMGSVGGTVTVNDPGKIQLRNGITVVKTTLNLNSNALGGGIGALGNTTNTFQVAVTLMVGAGGVAMGAGEGVADSSTRLIIDGVISGATSTLSINGAGVVQFTKNNTYTGLTNHNGNNGFGAIQIDSPAGLGAGGVGNETQLNRNGAGPTGSALWLNFSGALQDEGAVAEEINFAGAGVSSLGAIRLLGNNTATIPGDITFIAGAPWFFGVDNAGATLSANGVIDSQGVNRALTKVGAGALALGGAAANTFVGNTVVSGGTLLLNKTAAPQANAGVAIPAATLTIGNLASPGAPNSVMVSEGFAASNFQFGGSTVNGVSVVIAPDGVLDLNGNDLERIAGATALTMTGGTVSLTSGRLFVDGNVSINAGTSLITATTGQLDLDGGTRTFTVAAGGTLQELATIVNGAVSKDGPGTMVLASDNTYAGTTTINNGLLLINGFQPQSGVQINAGGTLGGAGTTGPISSTGGTLNPGDSTAIIHAIGDLTLDAASTLRAQINGDTAGSDYDQVVVAGAVELGNAILELLVGFVPDDGASFVLIENDGNEAVVGTFAGLPEGKQFAASGQVFTITYKGGSNNNDVVVTATGQRSSRFAVGSNPGIPAVVQVFDSTGTQLLTIQPFHTYQGGVRVATGDVNNDAFEDIIVGAGPGALGGHIKVFDGVTGAELQSFFSFDGFAGGVFVGARDVNGDGFADILAGAGQGGNGHVRVFDGQNLSSLASFYTFFSSPNNVQYSFADVDGNNQVEIVAAAGGQIGIFNLAGVQTSSLIPFAGFAGGLSLSAGDVDGDGADEIYAGADVNGHVKVFTGNGADVFSFAAYPSGGVNVAAADLDDDGKDDILTSPFNGILQVKAFSGIDLDLIQSFIAGPGNNGATIG